MNFQLKISVLFKEALVKKDFVLSLFDLKALLKEKSVLFLRAFIKTKINQIVKNRTFSRSL